MHYSESIGTDDEDFGDGRNGFYRDCASAPIADGMGHSVVALDYKEGHSV